MSAHYCINCPRCKRGCSICRRCACTEAELAELFKPFEAPPLTIAIGAVDVDDEQKPETD